MNINETTLERMPMGSVEQDPPDLAKLPASSENEAREGSPMLSEHLFHKIRILRDEGKGPVAIASTLGISRQTAAKYLESNSPPRYKRRESSTRIDPIASFDPVIRSLLERCKTLTAREVFEQIAPKGYKGSERTLNRRVNRIRGEKPKERFFEQEYPPGEQAQFDFKEKVEIPFLDGIRIVHIHFGTLPFSDICFVRGYPFKNYECFIDGIHSFFEKTDGVTDKARIDNLSPCVKKILPNGGRLYTKAFNTAIKHYGFGVLPCEPAKGNQKGDVERDIRTHANRIKNRIELEGIKFKDWNHLNNWLDEYIRSRHTDDQKNRFAIERETLKPLAAREEEIMCRIEEGQASLHGTVHINKSVYSVPDSAIKVKCRTVMGPFEVNIYRMDGPARLIATHPRQSEGEPSILLEHVLPSLLRKPGAMIRWAHRDLLFPNPIFRRFFSYLKRIDAPGAEREFLRSINLVHHVPLSEIAAGIELVLETNSKTLFEDLKTLLLGERRPADVIDLSSHLGQRPIKPELSKYDEFIPQKERKQPDDTNNDPRRTDAVPQETETTSDGNPVRRSGTTG